MKSQSKSIKKQIEEKIDYMYGTPECEVYIRSIMLFLWVCDADSIVCF